MQPVYFPKQLNKKNATNITQSQLIIKHLWQASRFIPDAVDHKVLRLVNVRSMRREGSRNATNIDRDVRFNSTYDVIRHIPRILQIGFLSPFPSMWFDHSRSASQRVMRTVSGFEMIVAYLALLFSHWQRSIGEDYMNSGW